MCIQWCVSCVVRCCRAVLRPLSCMGELVGEPGDSLVMTGLQLPSHPATGPAREALVGQIFLEFFRTVLYRLSHCCSRGRLLSTFSVAGDSLGSTPRLFRLTSRSTSSSINLLAAINAAAAMEQPGHGPSGPTVAVDKDRWIAYQTERRGLSPELHRQLVETVGLEQVAARVFSEGDPEGWYKQGLAALRECQEAEEKLLRTAGQVSAGECSGIAPQPACECSGIAPAATLRWSPVLPDVGLHAARAISFMQTSTSGGQACGKAPTHTSALRTTCTCSCAEVATCRNPPAAGAHLVPAPQRVQLVQQPPLVATTLPPLLLWGDQGTGPLSSSAAALKRRSQGAKGKAPKGGRRRALSEITVGIQHHCVCVLCSVRFSGITACVSMLCSVLSNIIVWPQ